MSLIKKTTPYSTAPWQRAQFFLLKNSHRINRILKVNKILLLFLYLAIFILLFTVINILMVLLRAGVHQFLLDGQDGRLGAVVYVQLDEDTADMSFYGTQGNI
ncbi:MAG: hypothetical protein BWY65_01436 [Firmicutes bacterium ADurb.Bin373]|nr:MAG: hypothetical protein BWY65_01436 [Firmicutes bacterium ADurb.Bin373]